MIARRFHFIIGLLLLLSAGIAWVMQSPAVLQWAWGRVEVLSRGVITAERVEGTLAGPIAITHLAIRLPRSDIDLSAVRFDWYPGRLLAGRFSVIELSSEKVIVTVHPREGGASSSSFAGVSAPLASSVDLLKVGELLIRRPAAEDLRFANIVVEDIDWHGDQLWVDELQVETPLGSVSGHGRLASRLDGEIDFHNRAALGGQWLAAPLELSGHIGGTLAEPSLRQRLSGPLQGELSGKIGWVGTLHWQAEAELQPFAVSRLRTGWRSIILGGHLQGSGDFIHNRVAGDIALRDARLGKWRGTLEVEQERRHIEIRQLALHGRGHAAKLEGRGTLQLVGAPDYVADAELDLQWKNIVWPMDGKSEQWRSDEGRAHLSGTLSNYHLVSELALVAPHYPASRWQLDADGDLHHLASRALRLQGLDGSAEGEASLTWSPQLSWQARLWGKGLDPGKQWPQWPGSLDIDIASEGVWGDTRSISIEVHALHGTLRERRFSGKGRVDYEAGQWQLQALQMAHGSARLSASGRIATPWSLQWQFEAPQLAELFDEARGAFKLRGSVRGEARDAQLTFAGEGRGLQWQKWRVQSAAVEGDIDLSSRAPSRLLTTLTGVMQGEQPLADSVMVSGDGTAALHTLGVRVGSAQGAFTLDLDGAYQQGQWQGRLHDGAWRGKESEAWLQQNPALLRVTATGATLEPFCWSSGGARGCVALQPHVEGGSELTTSLSGLPVALFSRWLPRKDIVLGGTLIAEGRAHFDHGLKLLQLDAHLEQGALHYRHPLDRSIDLLFKRFEFALASNSSGSGAQLDLLLDNGDALRLEGRLPGWLPGKPLPGSQAVTGSAHLAMRDLEWLTIMVPEILEPKGTISAQLALGGSAADPRLTGTLALTDGAVVIPRAGVTLRQIGISASSPDGVSLRLAGAARSGPGWVTLEGEVHGESLNKWHSELLLRGNRFEVVRLPSVHLLASPEVRVAIEPRRIELNGRLLVPEADIRLPELPTTVRSSSDVVLVGAAEQEGAASRWKIASRLTLLLGDYIRVEGYGFKGRVAGQLTIDEQPEQPATGHGELTVHDGRYKAYGQELTIEYGRMLFANSLLDDPGLDVRASRSKDEIKVGVNITGRLQRPELRLFSEPPMEESDALAYLLLGRPLRTASSSEATSVTAAATSLSLAGGERIAQVVGSEFGVDEVSLGTEYGAQDTALLLGKYLSPRLYVQYAVVFSSALNVTRLRYELTNHWYIKAESGEQQSADILYTFER